MSFSTANEYLRTEIAQQNRNVEVRNVDDSRQDDFMGLHMRSERNNVAAYTFSLHRDPGTSAHNFNIKTMALKHMNCENWDRNPHELTNIECVI